VQVIGLELYSDELDGRPLERGVVRTQWLEQHSTQLVGKRILIVDEVSMCRAVHSAWRLIMGCPDLLRLAAWCVRAMEGAPAAAVVDWRAC